MNKNKFVKFSLTVLSAAVLAACSSGGSGNDDAAKRAAAEAAQKQAQVKAAAEKAAAEAKAKAEKAAADAKAKAEKVAAEAKAAEAKAALEREALVKKTEEVGHKFVQKTNSNLNVGTGTATNSHASTSATAMRINLDPSLDTIVVAVPLDKDGKASKTAPQAYLEDYDFRRQGAALENKSGLHTLEHIYIGQNTLGDQARPVKDNHLTKTTTAGKQEGVAVVYEEGRLNYTDYEGKDVADPKVQRTQAFLATIDTDGKYATKYDPKVHQNRGSVSEVYGYRTFAKGNSLVDESVVESDLNNAPFTRLVDAKNQRYADGQLVHVQYGRVTANLHAAQEKSFKDGKDLADYGTKVVGFGKYKSNGTESHYFYRGIDDTKYSATLASDLSKYYHGKTDGKLNYQGHAVTYGIDHKFNSTDGIPNAIGYKQELLSGTHVAAEVDLATKSVTGNLYDVWRHGNRTDKGFKTEQVEIANFQGKLENNGSIAGSSTRKVDGDKGTFNANLFGDKAQELGGAIRSHESLQGKQWGAVFGAEIQNNPYKAPAEPAKPAKPAKPTPLPAWGESTDQRDTNSPIK